MSDLEEAGRGKKVNMKMGNQIALTTKRFVYIHVKFLILISNMFFFSSQTMNVEIIEYSGWQQHRLAKPLP